MQKQIRPLALGKIQYGAGGLLIIAVFLAVLAIRDYPPRLNSLTEIRGAVDSMRIENRCSGRRCQDWLDVGIRGAPGRRWLSVPADALPPAALAKGDQIRAWGSGSTGQTYQLELGDSLLIGYAEVAADERSSAQKGLAAAGILLVLGIVGFVYGRLNPDG